jgi:hypothetical protein
MRAWRTASSAKRFQRSCSRKKSKGPPPPPPGEGTHVSHRPAGRGRDHDHHVLAAEGGDDLAHARIEAAGLRVHPAQQLDLAIEIGRDRRLGQRVEIVRGAVAADRDHRRGRGAIRDGAGLARGFLEIGQGQVVGVGVAGALAGLGPDAGPLAHVPGRLLHRALLQHQLLADPVLEVEIRVVHAAREGRAQQPLHGSRVEAEPVREEALGAR